MNLLFYSGGSPDLNESLDQRLRAFLGRNGTITYIPASYEGGNEWFPCFKADKAKLGLKKVRRFDVDRPFAPEERKRALAADSIFLSGGNTFYFLHHLRKSGLLPDLRSFAEEGRLVFGVSAGSIIMSPDITIAGLVPGESDENTVRLKNTKGLGLVDFEVYPHYAKSRASISHMKRFTAQKSAPLYAFPDGSGIFVTDQKTEFIGNVTCFAANRMFKICGDS